MSSPTSLGVGMGESRRDAQVPLEPGPDAEHALFVSDPRARTEGLIRIVVTGGAGFIGANTVRALLEQGAASVVVIDDLSTGYASNLEPRHPSVDVRLCSILDRDALGQAMDGASAVIHLAAVPSVPRSIENPVRSHLANATGTLNVLEAARETGTHVILASSSSVYGATADLPKHEGLATRPRSPYAASKLAAESYAIAYAHTYGLEVLALRFFNVFGPFQSTGHAYAAVVPNFVSAALAGEPLTVHGDGRQSRDFTFVGSVTNVLLEAVRRRVTSPDPVNLAFGGRTTLLELIEILEHILGRELERRHGETRRGDVRDSQADRTALSALFPTVRPVPLREGLERTVEWFRNSEHAGVPTF